MVWALYSNLDDFSAAIGDAVAAGLDTDCNGATVGALWALQGKPIPDAWTTPWKGRVRVSLAGQGEQGPFESRDLTFLSPLGVAAAESRPVEIHLSRHDTGYGFTVEYHAERFYREIGIWPGMEFHVPRVPYPRHR